MPDEDSREISRDDASAEEPRAAEAAADGTEEPIDFLELGHGRREVLVRLAGQTYRLRWTRNDKLILTK